VDLVNLASFLDQDNHRFIQCQLSPAPDTYYLLRARGWPRHRLQRGDTQHQRGIREQQPARPASLNCTALDGGSDRSWVYAQTVRTNAGAPNDVSS